MERHTVRYIGNATQNTYRGSLGCTRRSELESVMGNSVNRSTTYTGSGNDILSHTVA